jgi:HlyD family secretion protein
MTTSIFREAALERLSTPDQLDRLVRVTRPLGWLALGVFFSVCSIALVWSCFAAFPMRVPALGMLVAEAGLMEVMAAHKGRVSALRVKPGDAVKAGQEVARLEQPDTSQELQLARTEVAELDEKHAALSALSGKETRARGHADDDRRKAILQAIVFKKERIAWQEEKLAQEKDMVTRGFISRPRMISSQIELNSARSDLASTENELKQLDAQQSGQTIDRQRPLMETEIRLNAARRKVAELQGRLARQISLVSPYDGVVAELKVNPGELVDAGASLFSVQREHEAQSLLAVIYVSPEEGKRITPGMVVQVSPSTVKREEFGFMLGTVARVASVPSTAEGMMRVLKNKPLTEKLSGGGAPFEVWVALERDPASVTGFRWSSFNPLLMKNTAAKGPLLAIGSNTLVQAHVTVREKRLITLLIPGLEPLFEDH